MLIFEVDKQLGASLTNSFIALGICTHGWLCIAEHLIWNVQKTNIGRYQLVHVVHRCIVLQICWPNRLIEIETSRFFKNLCTMGLLLFPLHPFSLKHPDSSAEIVKGSPMKQLDLFSTVHHLHPFIIYVLVPIT